MKKIEKITSAEDVKFFSNKMKEQLSGLYDFDDCALMKIVIWCMSCITMMKIISANCEI